MISTGNDIVALQATDKARSMDPRFYGRILSAQELSLYDQRQHSLDVFVWLIWSVKESVYKHQKRLHPDLDFAPHRLDVQQLTYSAESLDPCFYQDTCEWQVPGFHPTCSGVS